jgi:hypothetical protein
VLVQVDGGVNVGRVHHSLLDEQRLKRFHAQRDVRRHDLRYALPWLVNVCGLLRNRCRRREGRGTKRGAPQKSASTESVRRFLGHG